MKRRKVDREVTTDVAESRRRKGNAESGLPTPAHSSQQQSARNGRRHQLPEFDEPSSDSDTVALSQRFKKKKKRQSKLEFAALPVTASNSTPKKDAGNVASPASSKKKAFSIYGSMQQTHPSDNDSSDEIVTSSAVQPSARRITRSSKTPVKDTDALYKRRSTRRHKASIIESEDDEAENIEPQSVKQKNIFDDIGEPETSGDEILQSPPMKKSRLRRKGQTQADFEEELIELSSDKSSNEEQEEETDHIEMSSKRGSITSQVKIQRRATREQEELAEDLENLKSSPPPGPSTSSRTQRNVRQSALELLVKQRADKSKDSTVVGRRQRVMVSSESSEAENEDDASEHDGSDLEATYQDHLVGEEDDEDFIVEDEEGAVLGIPEMPLEFSNLSRMKGRDLFKYVVEWMVQKKLNPAFAMDDEIYDLAFKKLDDEVRGLAGSKFTSSAWTRNFTIALQGRPYLAVREIMDPARSIIYNRCEACNRSGHPATFELQFQGKPYMQDTLEDIENDEEDDDDENDNDERSEYDNKGRKVPPEHTIYHVGQFCMRNAHTAHALEHWRYHLNDFILDYLRNEGILDPEKIVERDSWKTKKRRKFAERVVDEMEASGEVKRLYHDFRVEIDDAREAKSAYSRGRNVEDFMFT